MAFPDFTTPGAFRFQKNKQDLDMDGEADPGTDTFYSIDTGVPALLLWTGSSMEAVTPESGITYTMGSWDGGVWVPGKLQVGVTPEIDTALDELWQQVIDPAQTGYMTVTAANSAISTMQADIDSKASSASLSGYVTTGGLSTALSSYATSTALTSGLAGKLDSSSFTWANLGGKPTLFSGAYADLTGKPSLFSGAYADLTGKPTIPSVDNASVLAAIGFTPVSQAGARSAISLTTTGSGPATYNSSTGVLNVPTPAVASITQTDNVSRTLNSSFTVSSTQRARLYYSLNVSWTIQALLSGSAAAFLEYSTNSGTTWVTVSNVGKSIGLLTFAGADDLNLSGEVPANALVRIRTTSTNMTPAYTRGQEVTY